MQITLTDAALAELHGFAAMFANLEGIGDGDMQATLAEIQGAGVAMLDLLNGGAA